jgi:hypothetical protein
MTYTFTTTLLTGNHSYYFVFGDGTTSFADPQGPGSYAGPNVSAAGAPPPPAIPRNTVIQPTPEQDPEQVIDPGG